MDITTLLLATSTIWMLRLLFDTTHVAQPGMLSAYWQGIKETMSAMLKGSWPTSFMDSTKIPQNNGMSDFAFVH